MRRTVSLGLPFVLRAAGLMRPCQTVMDALSLQAASGRTYHAKRVAPAAGGKNGGTIFLQHGLIAPGIDDPRLERLAANIASAGFTVIMPEVPALTALRLDLAAADQIEELITTVAAASAADGRCAFFGAGYAAGIGMIAAARPSACQKLSGFFGLGTFAEFRRSVAFGLKNGSGDAYAAFVVLQNFIGRATELTVDGLDALAASLHAAAVAVFAKAPLPDATPALSARDAATYRRLCGDAQFRDALAADLLGRLSEREARELSPGLQLRGLAAPAFLLHGRDDPIIPASETVEVAHLLRAAHHPCQALVSGAISHADRQPIAKAIPELPRLVSLFGGFLAAAKPRVA